MKAKDKDALPDLTRYEQDGTDMNPGQHGDWYRISDVNAALASRPAEVDERAAFEAWACQQTSLDLSLLPESVEGMGFYLSGHTQWIYDGWMARAVASRPAEVDEAWVLLFEALPHVPPQAVNWAMARVGPIEDAYIGTRIRKYLERVAAPSHATSKEN